MKNTVQKYASINLFELCNKFWSYKKLIENVQVVLESSMLYKQIFAKAAEKNTIMSNNALPKANVL